jgi:hypothetical protein
MCYARALSLGYPSAPWVVYEGTLILAQFHRLGVQGLAAALSEGLVLLHNMAEEKAHPKTVKATAASLTLTHSRERHYSIP